MYLSRAKLSACTPKHCKNFHYTKLIYRRLPNQGALSLIVGSRILLHKSLKSYMLSFKSCRSAKKHLKINLLTVCCKRTKL
jgi:hypothetical protein